MADRGLLAPHAARLRPAAVGPAAARTQDLGVKRPQFRTMLTAVTRPNAGPVAAERFAEWLAVEFWDVGHISTWRRISKGLQDGVLSRGVVSKALQDCQSAWREKSVGMFRRFNWDRSPWAIRSSRMRR